MTQKHNPPTPEMTITEVCREAGIMVSTLDKLVKEEAFTLPPYFPNTRVRNWRKQDVKRLRKLVESRKATGRIDRGILPLPNGCSFGAIVGRLPSEALGMSREQSKYTKKDTKSIKRHK